MSCQGRQTIIWRYNIYELGQRATWQKKKMYKTVISDTHVGHNQEVWLLLKKSLYLRKNSTGDKSCLLLETSKFDMLTEVMDLRKVSTVCVSLSIPLQEITLFPIPLAGHWYYVTTLSIALFLLLRTLFSSQFLRKPFFKIIS